MKPTKSGSPKCGLEQSDAMRIQDHVLATQLFTNTWQYLAADVNGDQLVSSFDAFLVNTIRTGGSNPAFINWRFIPTFIYPFLDPIGGNFGPEVRIVTVPSGGISNVDFYGIKRGDVVFPYCNSCNAATSASDRAEEVITADPTYLYVEDRPVEAGEEIEIVVQADGFNSIFGFSLAVALDSNYLNIVNTELSDLPIAVGALRTDTESNAALVSWTADQVGGYSLPNGGDLMMLKVKVLKSAPSLLSLLRVEPSVLASEVITAQDQRGQFVWGKPNVLPAGSLKAAPNPFNGEISISFDMGKAGEVQFIVSDISGKTVASRQAYYDSGEHVWQPTELENLPNGIYLCQFNNGQSTQTLKLVKQ